MLQSSLSFSLFLFLIIYASILSLFLSLSLSNYLCFNPLSLFRVHFSFLISRLSNNFLFVFFFLSFFFLLFIRLICNYFSRLMFFRSHIPILPDIEVNNSIILRILYGLIIAYCTSAENNLIIILRQCMQMRTMILYMKLLYIYI